MNVEAGGQRCLFVDEEGKGWTGGLGLDVEDEGRAGGQALDVERQVREI